MEVHQLAYFVAVVEEKNFTRAAARLRVAQPSVSQQIRRLERELGESLLDRTGRTVRLTAAGTALLPHARAALGALSSGRQAVDELRGLISGEVSIGITASLPVIDLPRMLTEFREHHPGIQISLTETDAAAVLDGIRTGEFDIGLASLAEPPPAEFSGRHLGTLPLVIATSTDDPLAGHHRGPLRLIEDRPLITLPRGSALRQILDTGCERAEFRPRISYQASSLPLLIELTARGLGVAVVPAWAVHTTPVLLHTIEIDDPELHGYAFLMHRANEPVSPAARAFLDLIEPELTVP
ncbi:LysR family transcriptional regulator [Nocardia sp. NBC_01388]|uniref:LysR family transcriptional regulator n=1 Tax=Nocardia sp. NBC_01388 TaxID=2903596 RepID=UPI0032454B75